MKLYWKGAEAVVTTNGKTVIKKREPKGYRIKELDDKLRLFRTKREAKVMDTLAKAGLNVPNILNVDEKTATIRMNIVEGEKLRDALATENCGSICQEVGRMIGVMHQKNIVHGDLTTSNMILEGKDVYFIDFGLSSFSNREEDKAVDLHLFSQALESSHHEIAKKCFETALQAYKKTNSGCEKVLERLKEVEERGRNKHK
jgi:Kae1-associated kinase Bud32